MRIFEARDIIADRLEGDYHASWVGFSNEDRNAWAQPLAYGEIEVEDAVARFIEFCD